MRRFICVWYLLLFEQNFVAYIKPTRKVAFCQWMRFIQASVRRLSGEYKIAQYFFWYNNLCNKHMNEGIDYVQLQRVDTFTEPQVHPDIDSYFREKLAQAIAIKQRQDKIRTNRKFVKRLDTREADEALLTA